MAQSDPTTVLPKAPRLRKIIVVLARHERDFLMLSEDESEYGTGSRSPEPLAWAEGEETGYSNWRVGGYPSAYCFVGAGAERDSLVWQHKGVMWRKRMELFSGYWYRLSPSKWRNPVRWTWFTFLSKTYTIWFGYTTITYRNETLTCPRPPIPDTFALKPMTSRGFRGTTAKGSRDGLSSD